MAVVKYSADSEVTMTFPVGVMDDDVRGRVSLVNDSDTNVEVSPVTTSCGCTSAIPTNTIIKPGEHGFILIHYRPDAVGQTRVEARFSFGDKNFTLSGLAKTTPRFQQSTAQLTFEESGGAELRLEKRVPTKVDRLEVFPPSMKVQDFKKLTVNYFPIFWERWCS